LKFSRRNSLPKPARRRNRYPTVARRADDPRSDLAMVCWFDGARADYRVVGVCVDARRRPPELTDW